MRFLLYISRFMIPLVIVYMVTFGVLMKRPVYDDFAEGAKEGARTVVGVFPTLVGLMVGTGILRASGLLEWFAGFLAPVAEKAGVPCSNWAGAGHFQGIRAGFPDRIDGIAAAFLYRNYFLYDESVFYGSRGQKNPLYTSRGADGDSLRDVHEHFNGKSWLFVRKL